MKKNFILVIIAFTGHVLNAQWVLVKDFSSTGPGGSGTGLVDFHFINDSSGITSSYFSSGISTSGYVDQYIDLTTDYGTTWTDMDYVPGSTFMFPTILQGLHDPDSIIRANYTGFELSVNKGDTWSLFCNPGPIEGQFDFLDGNNGFMYDCYPGDIFKRYRNGSITSILVPAGVSGINGITDIEMISPAKIFAIAETRDKLIVSNDSGYTWTTALDTTTLFNHIEFTSALTGYVVCDNQQVYKTTDGGLTWILKGITGTNALKWSSFSDDSTGVVAGNSGVVYSTTDGGNTWTAMHLGENINKIQSLNGLLYCSTTEGNLYRNFSPLSVNEKEQEKISFSVYPNPAHDRLTISNTSQEKIQAVQLLNTIGQVEFSQVISSNETQINLALPALTSGIKYLVIQGANTQTYKLVIE